MGSFHPEAVSALVTPWSLSTVLTEGPGPSQTPRAGALVKSPVPLLGRLWTPVSQSSAHLLWAG